MITAAAAKLDNTRPMILSALWRLVVRRLSSEVRRYRLSTFHCPSHAD